MTVSRIRRPVRAGITTDDAAADAIARLAEIRSERATLDETLHQGIASLQLAHGSAVQPFAEEEEQLVADLLAWATHNRPRLTRDGRVKSATVGAGRVSWRMNPPRIEIEDGDDASIVQTLRQLGLGRFIRSKESVDKQAMLKEPDIAGTVAGVSVVPGGETFIVDTKRPK